MADETVYIIPLKSGYHKAVRNNRATRSVNVIREYLIRHTKAESASISPRINQALWSSSRQKPPKSIKVRVKIEDNVAVAKAMDEMFIEKAKEESKSRLEKMRDKVTSQPGVLDKAEKPAEKPKEEKPKETPKPEAMEKPKEEAKTDKAKPPEKKHEPTESSK